MKASLKQAGFTLVELLAVLAISAILLVIAIPSGKHFLTQNCATAYVNTLLGALHYARSESVFRNQKLTFCKSADHKTCGGDWRDGQILQGPDKAVLRVFPALSSKDKLIWRSSAGLNDAIVWLPTGYTNGQRGTFYYCTDHQMASRSIVLLDTGRSYVSPLTAADYASYCRLS